MPGHVITTTFICKQFAFTVCTLLHEVSRVNWKSLENTKTWSRSLWKLVIHNTCFTHSCTQTSIFLNKVIEVIHAGQTNKPFQGSTVYTGHHLPILKKVYNFAQSKTILPMKNEMRHNSVKDSWEILEVGRVDCWYTTASNPVPTHLFYGLQVLLCAAGLNLYKVRLTLWVSIVNSRLFGYLLVFSCSTIILNVHT